MYLAVDVPLVHILGFLRAPALIYFGNYLFLIIFYGIFEQGMFLKIVILVNILAINFHKIFFSTFSHATFYKSFSRAVCYRLMMK